MKSIPLLALLLSGCAMNMTPTAPSAPEPDLSGVMNLVGRFASAHACPVSPTLALTNAHVADRAPYDRQAPLFAYEWSDESGHSGTVVPVGVELARDIAPLEPYGEGNEFPRFYETATGEPQPGASLWLVGYEWKSAELAFSRSVIKTTVVRVVAHHIIMAKSGEPGSSGSCVLNSAGEVVGINSGGYEMKDGAEVGIAVGVWK